MFIDTNTEINKLICNEEFIKIDERIYDIITENESVDMYSMLNEGIIKQAFKTNVITDARFKEKAEDIKRELEDINDDLEGDKVELSDMKRSYNRILGVIIEILGLPVAYVLGDKYGSVAYNPNEKGAKLRASIQANSTGIVIGIAVALFTRTVSGMLYRRAQRKDIETMKRDINRLKGRFRDKMNKDPKRKKMYQKNIDRLDALLDKIERKAKNMELD